MIPDRTWEERASDSAALVVTCAENILPAVVSPPAFCNHAIIDPDGNTR